MKRPNIVLIISDDMGYSDLPLYGGRDIPMPNLDRLAVRRGWILRPAMRQVPGWRLAPASIGGHWPRWHQNPHVPAAKFNMIEHEEEKPMNKPPKNRGRAAIATVVRCR